MAHLKAVIFGVDNVLTRMGTNDFESNVLTNIGRLVRFLRSRGIEPVVLTNRNWTMTWPGTNEPPRPTQEVLQEVWGCPISWLRAGDGKIPWKQRAAALEYVRKTMGFQANETLYVGNSEADMQSAINGRVLLLNAQWFCKQMDYGFQFQSPKEIARFIDVFCLRDHFWFWRVEDGGRRVYALAPYSTKISDFKGYSDNFLTAVKSELGNDGDFWAKYLCTSLYFSGLYDSINYITSYPKHMRGQYPEVLNESMTAFAKCFHKNYLPDLIVRHTDAVESKRNRAAACHAEQLNTICLRPDPIKRGEERYRNPPLRPRKTVLVVDDICTQGFSFEAAGAYIRETGADVVFVSLLKTLNRDYLSMRGIDLPNGPYRPNHFEAVTMGKPYDYRSHIVDRDAPTELGNKLRQYHRWDWPDDV